MKPFRIDSRFGVLLAVTGVWLAWLIGLPPRPSSWIVVLSGLPLIVVGSWIVHGAHAEPWLAFVKRTADLHGLVLVLLIALGIQFEDAHGITTDGAVYFSLLRSAIFDGDFEVEPELIYLGQPARPNYVVPVGPTFLWLIPYVVVAAVDIIGRELSLWSRPEDAVALGMTLPYVRAALLTSFAVGSVGLIALHRYLREEFAAGPAFATTLLIFGATPLVWYMVYEPAMTHAVSFGLVALFVVNVVRRTAIATKPRDGLLLGALLGAVFLSRPQEVIFALVPAVLILSWRETLRVKVKAALRLAGWALLGATPFLLAQAIQTAIVLTTQEYIVTGTAGYLNFTFDRWDDTLWSSWHGFLSWSPVAYVAAMGTAAYIVRRRWWAVTALAILWLTALVNSATTDWAAGWSFGGRRFVSCLVLLAPGLALTLEALVRRPLLSTSLVALVFALWNQLLIAQYRTGMLRTDQLVSFGQIVRQQAALATRAPFFFPFAFPANAWFAWRNDLPIDRYDLLGPEPLESSLTIVFDASSSKYVMQGWGPRAGDEWGELRWIDGTSAELIAPLDPSLASSIELHVEWRARLLDPPASAAVRMLVNGVNVGRSIAGPGAPVVWSTQTDAAAWRRGFNRIVLEKENGAPPVGVYRLIVKGE